MTEYKFIDYSKMGTGELKSNAEKPIDDSSAALRMQMNAQQALNERLKKKARQKPSGGQIDDGAVNAFEETELSGIFRDTFGNLWAKKGTRMTRLGDDAIGLYKK